MTEPMTDALFELLSLVLYSITTHKGNCIGCMAQQLNAPTAVVSGIKMGDCTAWMALQLPTRMVIVLGGNMGSAIESMAL